MTIAEASERFGVSPEKLRFYESSGLFDCHKRADGSVEYSEELMDYVGLIHLLVEAGADMDALREFMQKLMRSAVTKEEKLRFLRRQRQALLDDIHEKQKSLDALDYMIFHANKATK